MIRVNLIPGNKKKQSFAASGNPETRGAMYLGVMAVGWCCVAGAAYWVLDSVEEETKALRAKSEKNRKRTEEIRKMIDEEALLARQKKVEDLRKAIRSVQEQKRSPVFVMYELAQVLSTGKSPDIDEEKQRRLEATDPLSRLNTAWDASSVWLTGLENVNKSTLILTGSARDPADLDEFLKRLRSSVRFNHVTHPKFDATASSKGKGKSDRLNYKFKFKANVAFWD